MLARGHRWRQQVSAALRISVLVLAPMYAEADSLGSAYRSEGQCGPFAKVQVRTPSWACVGIVAGPAHGLMMPRAIVEIAPGRFVITDMGRWSPGYGRVLQLDVTARGSVQISTLYDLLDLPHGLSIGPDNYVYVGERSRIWRFDPTKPQRSKEMVIDGLPSGGLHRLKHIVFDRKGDLVINVGAPTDRCETAGRKIAWPCPADASDRPSGALWRLRLSGNPTSSGRLEPLARGLRNSMALVVHYPSGLLLQGENSADYPDENFPPDELNVIQPGKHYGWPYCVGNGIVIPDYRKFGVDCRQYAQPVAILPAHSAPLGMVYYSGKLFHELSNNLIIAYHGYRINGHRIVALAVDETGLPSAYEHNGLPSGNELVGGWDRQPGIRPRGSPVGLSVAKDGSLWFVEDKNQTVMVVLRSDRSGAVEVASQRRSKIPRASSPPPVLGWAKFYQDVVRPQCAPCHAEFRIEDSGAAWERSVQRGWLKLDELPSSSLFQSMLGREGFLPMPPMATFSDAKTLQKLNAFLASLPKHVPEPAMGER